MSVFLPNDLGMAEVVAVQIATFRLCLKIVDKFKKENKYGEAFDSYVADLLGKMEK